MSDDTEHKGFLAWWARNSVAANLLMVTTIALGILGFLRMEREVFPTVAFNGVNVGVSWPGASPQEVEEQIILRIEESLVDVGGVEEITATAFEGFASVNVEANTTIDMNAFLDEVQLRVNAVSNLPRDSFPPRVTRWRNQEQQFIIAVHGAADRRELQRMAEEVRDEISAQVWGASLTETMAVLGEEVSIEISEADLRRYGLSLNEVASAIRASSLNSSGGTVRTSIGDVPLNARALADSAEEFGEIIVRQEAGGATIRVRDIATVVDGFVDANMDATYDGEPMAMVQVLSTEVMDISRTARDLREYIEEKNEALPPGMTVSLWLDQSEAFDARMSTISSSAMIGLALVLIVLVLFLRPIVAFWVTIGIFTAFAGAFAFLPYLGVSLNMLSTFAFLLVIGIVVDDAIIVGENIHNQVENGKRGITAATLGVQLVAKPVVFAVITTIMAFAPWAMLSGPEVEFTRGITLVVASALFFSLVESLLILPAHLAHMKPQSTTGVGGFLTGIQKGIADSLLVVARRIYRPLAKLAIRGRGITTSLFVFFWLGCFGLLSTGWVGTSFMPDIESEMIRASVSLPEGTPYSRSLEIRDQLDYAMNTTRDEIAQEYPDAVPIFEGSASITSDGRVQAWIMVAAPEIRPGGMATSDVAQRIRDHMGPVPDAESISLRSNMNAQNPGIQFAISAANLDDLRAGMEDLKNQLREYAVLYDITDNLQSAQEEVRFSLRPDAQALGLTLSDVANQVRQAYYGIEVQRLPRDGQDVRVMVRYPRETRTSLDSLRDLRIRTNDGREVPLGAVADLEFAPGLARINRRDRMRTAVVSAEARDGEVLGDIRRELDADFFPEWDQRHPGVNRRVTGDAEGEADFLAEVAVLLLFMVGAMYLLLAAAFRSYFQPLLIMSAIPFAFAGAVVGHVVMGLKMDLFSVFGVGAAAGVVINDNLVLVDFVNRLRREGVGAFQALVDAGVARFRPILLTSVTTFIGILPMMMENSTDAAFLKSMVVSLAYGVLFAFFLTLFFVPALYGIGVDIARFFRGLWRGERQPALGENYSDTDFDHGEMPGHLKDAPAE